MDKMVRTWDLMRRNVSISLLLDSNLERRVDHHQRRSDYFEEHPSTAPRCQDGTCSAATIHRQKLKRDQLVDLSAAQDVEAGDGTTSVVVLAGSLLGAAEKMLQKGIHPTVIAESFQKASAKAVEYLTELSTPINLDDKTSLLRAATTSLNSKVSLVDIGGRRDLTRALRSYPSIRLPLLLSLSLQ